jgi:hypothetical protein
MSSITLAKKPGTRLIIIGRHGLVSARCCGCKQIKNREEFGKNHRNVMSIASLCKICTARVTKEQHHKIERKKRFGPI